MRWLWDTNVVSEAMAKRPNPKVLNWMNLQAAGDSAISIVTLAELRAGAETAPGERRRQLNDWIEESVVTTFEGHILPLSLEIVTGWLAVGRRLAAKRITRDPADMLIAATARVHALIVVTRNMRDFAGTGITVYNPWTDETTRMDTA
jgi:toxin FitB